MNEKNELGEWREIVTSDQRKQNKNDCRWERKRINNRTKTKGKRKRFTKLNNE